MEKATINRAALGQVAALGDLYDARNDNFCEISIFKKNIPAGALKLTDNHFSDVHLLNSDTFSEKFNKLDVSAELQVSVLAGLFKLEGSGRYLNEQKTSSHTVKSSLLYNIKTKNETINIYHEDLKEAFSIDAIESGMATHVVVGIGWGANLVLSCEYQNTGNRDVKEIEGSLSASMKLVAKSVSGKAELEYKEGDNKKGIQFEIRVFGDVIPQNQDLPTTIEETLALMKQMPGLVATANEGRGKPLTYRLLPISLLKEYLNFSAKTDSMIKSLEEESLLRVVHLFEQGSQVRQQLNDFYQDASDYKVCIRPEDMVKVISLKKEFSINETKLRSNLASTLLSVRSGKSDVSALENLMESYRKGDYSPDKILLQLITWAPITEKLNCAKSLVANRAKYIGFGISLDEEMLKDFEAKTFVLFFKDDAKTENPEKWKNNRQLFLQEMRKDSGSKYFAVDCDINLKLWPKGGISIQILQNGKVITENLLEDQEETANIPLAQSMVAMEQILDKPNKRVNLVMPCTGRNCQPKTDYEWRCKKCDEVIEYGFNNYFYCSCGRALASMYEFKCTDNKHGVAFEKHDEKYITELLARIRPFKEMNILILGETGVGKSTWINGFVNCLNFKTLKEAEDCKPITLIPSEFTMCNENFEEITVSTGVDKNEVQIAGQSATQDSKVYPFIVGNTKVRLIDTPGIGDTRGIDQDKKNFQNILNTLSNLEELHGICILLKPNNARLTVMFRFCIKELLTYLHKDASRNIMFCFTNCRGTFYRPGDTMPALRNLLKENKEVPIEIAPHTVYCYDSEAYRFLAAVKNSTRVTFPEDERENFEKSWTKSMTETKRMLKHISGLKPHPIQNTLNLNHARDLVVKLTRPLAEISKMIQRTKVVINDQLEEVKRTNENIKDLQKKLLSKIPQLKITKLDYPKTVCTHSSCTKTFGSGNHMQTQYITVCHDHCRLGGSVSADTLGDLGLLQCFAFHEMPGGNCRRCRHSYREHLHAYYDSEEIMVDVEDEAVKKSLSDNSSAAVMKQKMIDGLRKKNADYDAEQKEIEKASAKFACFLKSNAITPYNDATLDYMDHLIREENNKSKIGGQSQTLELLKTHRDSYMKQIEILEKEMERGDTANALKPDEVQALVNSLYKLKYNGETLKSALTAISETQQQVFVYQEVVPKMPGKKKYKFYDPRGWLGF